MGVEESILFLDDQQNHGSGRVSCMRMWRRGEKGMHWKQPHLKDALASGGPQRGQAEATAGNEEKPECAMSVEPKESLLGREQQLQGPVLPRRADIRPGLKTGCGFSFRRPWVFLVGQFQQRQWQKTLAELKTERPSQSFKKLDFEGKKKKKEVAGWSSLCLLFFRGRSLSMFKGWWKGTQEERRQGDTWRGSGPRKEGSAAGWVLWLKMQLL